MVEDLLDARERAAAVAGVGLLPGLPGLVELVHRVVLALACPGRIIATQEAKHIAGKPCTGALRLEVAHDRHVLGQLGLPEILARRRAPRRLVHPVEIRLEALVGGILIVLRDKVPALAAEEGGKEPTGIGRTDNLGMLGQAEEGEPVAGTVADEPLRVCLLKEGEEPGCILEVCGYDVPQGWGRGDRLRSLVFYLELSTSLAVRGRGDALDGRRWLSRVRLWSGLLVFKLLEGFCVFLGKGW
jgi:hypothetical protein